MEAIISNITKSTLFVLSCYLIFLFVVLQCSSFNDAEAQTYNKIEYVYYIEQMKGHLEQAVTNKENGNNSLSRAHILHSIAETYDLIEVQLATTNSNLNALLFHSLDELSKNVEGLNSSQFKRDIDKVNWMLNEAIDLVVPENNSTLNLIAAAWLLDTATENYQSGVTNGNVTHLVEYQDSIGFISRSESLFNDSLPMLNQSMRIPADQAMSLFSLLNSKVQDKADINDIQTSTNEIKQKISKITGFYLP